MSTIEQASTGVLETVTFDLYRDIHKGIRVELFGTTALAGNVNPSDSVARSALSRKVAALWFLLETHAAHEDHAIQPYVEAHLPDVAAVIERDHLSFDRRMEDITTIARDVVDVSGPSARRHVEHLYSELATFTSSYLAHQDIEERVVMPMLERELGVEGVFDIHRAIVSSNPPNVMATAFAIMLPAMNIDDRTEMLAGMQHGAPAEVFAGIWCLAGSVLSGTDYAELGARLGLN